MDLLVLIIIVIAGLIIKYLIDVIANMGKEIREIKDKCIRHGSVKKLNNDDTYMPVKNLSKDIIKNISYFKDYF